jgi:hypothetical protein
VFSTRHWSTGATPWRCLRQETGGWRCPDWRRYSCDWSNFWDLAPPVAPNADNGTITFFNSSALAPGIDKVAVAPLNG